MVFQTSCSGIGIPSTLQPSRTVGCSTSCRENFHFCSTTVKERAGTNTNSACSLGTRSWARGVCGCLLDTLLLISDTLISVFFVCIMQWDDKELDTQFTPNVYFWTPNSQILAKSLPGIQRNTDSFKNIHRTAARIFSGNILPKSSATKRDRP